MTTNEQLTSVDLARKVELNIHLDSEQRDPLTLAYLTAFVLPTLCAAMLWVEWENIGLALRQLFPTYRDGSSDLDGTYTLAFASVSAILCGEVLMEKASKHWSDRTRRWVDRTGMAALALFTVSAMILIPASTWQSSDMSDAGGGAVSQGTYLSFALMLAALFPLSLFANFTMLEKLKPALAKIVRALRIDQRIEHKRALLAKREATQAALREVAQRQAHASTDAQLADEYAAEASAVIGQVAGQLRRAIIARYAGNGSADAPFVATDDDLLNHQPIERLEAQFDYLTTFTPEAIRQRIIAKETLS